MGGYPIYGAYDCMYVGLEILLLPLSGEYLIYRAYDYMYVVVVISSLPPSGGVSIYGATEWIVGIISSLLSSGGSLHLRGN